MRRRIHPLRVQARRVETFGNILSDHAESRAGSPSAILQSGLARELVRKRVVLHHQARVSTRGVSKIRVPLKGRQTRSRAIAISSVE